jgi:hypothetical protein
LSWEESGISYAPYTAAVRSALHGRKFDAKRLGFWLMTSLQSAHLPLSGTDLKIRWVGKISGRQVAVYTVQQPGQGVLAFAEGTVPGALWGTDLQLLLPAQGIDARPIAYRLTKNHRGGPHVVVIAPEKATRVTVTAEGGKPVEVHLSSSGMGMTTIDPEKEATATAYAADGSEMGSTPVRGSASFDQMVGDTPGTRIVP